MIINKHKGAHSESTPDALFLWLLTCVGNGVVLNTVLSYARKETPCQDPKDAGVSAHTQITGAFARRLGKCG